MFGSYSSIRNKYLATQARGKSFDEIRARWYSGSERRFNRCIRWRKLASLWASRGLKSILADVFRFHDITGGEIIVEGQNIMELWKRAYCAAS